MKGARLIYTPKDDFHFLRFKDQAKSQSFGSSKEAIKADKQGKLIFPEYESPHTPFLDKKKNNQKSVMSKAIQNHSIDEVIRTVGKVVTEITK